MNGAVFDHHLRMKSLATHFRLWEPGERLRSVRALENAYFGFLRILQPDTFVEAGAHNAKVSVRARSLLPNAQICAYEANPYNYATFKNNRELAEHAIRYDHYALSDRAGTVRFNVRTKFEDKDLPLVNPRSSILRVVDERVGTNEVTVPCTTLDTQLPLETFKSCALWVDVEGANREVLSGGAGVLSRTSLLMIEVEDNAVWQGQWVSFDVIDHLSKLGLYPVARDFQSRTQYNIIFLNRDAMLNADIAVSIDYFHSVRIHEPQVRPRAVTGSS